MSNIKWLTCPACRYRFYIIEEQAGQGFLWFCPSCKHEFHEGDMVQPAEARRPAGAQAM